MSLWRHSLHANLQCESQHWRVYGEHVGNAYRSIAFLDRKILSIHISIAILRLGVHFKYCACGIWDIFSTDLANMMASSISLCRRYCSLPCHSKSAPVRVVPDPNCATPFSHQYLLSDRTSIKSKSASWVRALCRKYSKGSFLIPTTSLYCNQQRDVYIGSGSWRPLQ